MKIGFIGQGFIGKNLADNFEDRGYKVVRYSLEKEYIGNKDAIKECEIVFIAVPTPSTPSGFDYSAVESAVNIIPAGSIAVIKSTILPDVARKIWNKFPAKKILTSPEFLTEATAKYDTDFPDRNIIGVPCVHVGGWIERADKVLAVLPASLYNKIVTYEEAALIKYGGNCFLYTKNTFFNSLYDLAEQTLNVTWENVREGIIADARIDLTHTSPVHKNGRGAGGHCLIKDFSAFIGLVSEMDDNQFQLDMLKANEAYNKDLLISSGKDLDLLDGVYGDERTKT